MSLTESSRPRSAPEIVDGAIQLIRRNYLSLLTVTAVGFVPFTLIQMTVFRRLVAAAGAGTILQLSQSRIIGYYAVMLPWSALIDLSLTLAAADAYRGRSIDLAGVFQRTLQCAVKTLAAFILKYALIAAYAVLCFLPLMAILSAAAGNMVVIGLAYIGCVCAFLIGAITLVALFFAATAAIALEGTGPIVGLRRSLQLSSGHVGHVLLGLGLAYLIYFVGQSPAFLLTALGGRTAVQFLSVGTTILLFPIVSVTRVLLYYDARIRNEGYDLELMVESMSVAGAPHPPASTATPSVDPDRA